MSTRQETLAGVGSFVEQRRARITDLYKRIEELELAQSALELSLAVMTAEFEGAPEMEPRNGSAPTELVQAPSQNGTRLIDKIVQVIIDAGGPVDVDTMREILLQQGEDWSLATIAATCSNKKYQTLVCRVAPKTYDVVREEV